VAIGRVGFGSDQFDFLEKIGSDRVRSGSGRVGSIYMLCFFRLLIDFNWIEGHLISGQIGSNRIRIGSDQFDFLKKSIRIEFEFGQVRFRSERIKSGSTTSSF
jgi:hypothetical protein